MPDSLLAALSVRFSDQAENIATDSLCYVLQRSGIARKALLQFVGHYAYGMPAELLFATQLQNREGGISDLVGKDNEQHLRLIVESKFWAGLTDKQPVAYLRSLPKTHPGVLLVLAPEKRLVTLWPELKRRLVESRVPVIPVEDSAGPHYVVKTAENTFLILTSWRSLLDVLHSALVGASDLHTAGDVVQLQGLAARMDMDAFLPLRSEELAPIHGRRTLDFCSLVDDVAARLKEMPGISSKGLRATGANGSYGRYLTVHEYGVFLRFNAHYWVSMAETPLWLDVRGKKWAYSPELKSRLESLEHEQPPRLYPIYNNGFAVPLFLPIGQERLQVVDALVEQVLVVASHLAPDTATAI